MAKTKNVPPVEELTPPDVVNLTNVQVDRIDAELVRINRSWARDVNADESEMAHSNVGVVSGGTISGHDSWIGGIQADQVLLNGGGVVALQAHEVDLKGNAGVVMTDHLSMAEGATVGVLSAGEVKAEKVRTVVLLARNVEGNVETVLDTRRVLLASLVAGIAAGGMYLLGELLFRRRNR